MKNRKGKDATQESIENHETASNDDYHVSMSEAHGFQEIRKNVCTDVKAKQMMKKLSKLWMGEGIEIKRIRPEVSIRKFKKKGYGIVSNQRMLPGLTIFQYVGEIVSTKPKDTSFLMEYEKNLYIDAKHKGNLSRFINNACSNANCEVIRVSENGKLYVYIRTIKTIGIGDEITYNYNWTFPKNTIIPTCQCGSKNCTRRMGTYEQPKLKTKSKKLNCQECSAVFTRNDNLLRHLSSIHPENPKHFQCDICNWSFNRLDNLTLHIKKRHVNSFAMPTTLSNLSIECPDISEIESEQPMELDQMFKLEKPTVDNTPTYCSLRQVRATKKKYHCHQCKNSFANCRNLQRHFKEIHMPSFKKKTCSYCQKGFNTEFNRRRHEIVCKKREK